LAGTYEIPSEGSFNSTEDPKIKTILKGYNESLNSLNKLEASSLATGALGRLYKPVVIATKQERESTEYGKLTTADEVKEVVLPENGLIMVGYSALWRSSVASAGKAAIFLGANQVQGREGEPKAQEATSATTTATPSALSTEPGGLRTSSTASSEAADVTTGQILCSLKAGPGGVTYIFAAAGTYNVSIQFKATSGKVIVQERKLWVGVLGV